MSPLVSLCLFTWVECSSLKIHDVAAGLHYCKQHYITLLCYLAESVSLPVHSEDILHGSLSGVCGYAYPCQFTYAQIIQSGIVINASGTALLSDFALSTLVDEHGSPLFGQSQPEPGTLRWTAPESLAGGNGNAATNVLTKKSDIYSFGGVMLQVRNSFFNLVSPALKRIGGTE